MRAKLLGSISLLAIVAGAGAATAADLARPVYKAPPPPVVISDWAGFYLGVHGGGGWADDKINGAGGRTASGGVGGGHVGYNWQFGNVVAGVEGDFDGAGLTARNGGIKQDTDELASARARFGYVFAPNLLAYGTGGFGWAHTKLNDNLAGVSGSVSQPGWIAGGGLEYKVFGPLIARGEYLHYGLGSQTDSNVGVTLKESVDVVRGGLSYKF